MAINKFPEQLLLILISLIMATLAACGSFTQSNSTNTGTGKLLQFPNAEYYSIVEVDEDVIAFSRDSEYRNSLWYAKEGDKSLRKLTIPEDPRCGLYTNYHVDSTFSNGDLQLWESCFNKVGGTLTYIWSYDWRTGRMREIAGPLPLGTKQVSWNPDGTRGVAFLYSGLARSTLFWVWKGGFGSLDLVVSDGNRSWNLKNFFPDFPHDDDLTRKTGEAGPGDWAPNGETIAFFASPDAIGKTGFSRFDAKYGLYLMDIEQLQVRRILDNIYSPSSTIKWSPDSTYIAFIGGYGKSKKDGIWLYSIKSNLVTEVAQGIFTDLLWLPDGKSLIAIQCDDINNCIILKFDLMAESNQ